MDFCYCLLFAVPTEFPQLNTSPFLGHAGSEGQSEHDAGSSPVVSLISFFLQDSAREHPVQLHEIPLLPFFNRFTNIQIITAPIMANTKIYCTVNDVMF